MNLRLSSGRAVLWALAAATMLSAPVAAQQSTAPLPSPTTNSALQDAPKNDAAQALKPVAPPPIATAVDRLPLAKLKLPKDFKIEVYASGMTNARSLRLSDKGTLFVSTRLLDHIYAVTNKDGKHEVKTLFSGL